MKFSKEFVMLTSLCLFLMGCASSASFYKTGNFVVPLQGQNSDFDIFTIPPKVEYEEIGVIEFSGSFYSGEADGPKNIAEVRKMATPYVNKVGGNGLLLWECNAFGRYKKATIIYIKNK